VLAISTLLNAAYFLPVIYVAFWRAPPASEPAHGEAPWPSVLALVVTAAATIALPFAAAVPLALARAVAG
jgi:multicomponent Na+:H+ antiporter subunit D